MSVMRYLNKLHELRQMCVYIYIYIFGHFLYLTDRELDHVQV
jgi:hypothetical protein